MGFWKNKIELHDTIEKLTKENSELKFEIEKKSQQIEELTKINNQYEEKYINTNLECEFCYTRLQKEFTFCPKCGKKIVIKKKSESSQIPTSDIFQTERDGEYLLINQYNGFCDKKIIIPSQINGIPIIGIWNNVFEKCIDLEEVIFEEGCQYIGKSVFSNCSKLKKVRLPKSLIEIGDSAFGGCSNLEEIAIPTNVKVIGRYAFYGCRSLKSIILPDNLKCISDGMLSSTGIKEITIPQSVLHIDYSAFSDTLLTEIELPYNLYSIKSYAFDIPTLRKIIIHSNVEIISSDIFGKRVNPIIYCALGSKALLYARKYGLKCEEIPKQVVTNNSICVSKIIFALGSIPKGVTSSSVYKILGINKAATWSWEYNNNFKIEINKNMDINEARNLERLFIQYTHTYTETRRPGMIGYRDKLSLCRDWGYADV